MGGTFTCLNYHIIFSTKDRRPLIVPALRADLYKYIGGIIKGEDGIPDHIGGTEDHIHLLVRYRPDAAISDLVQKVKSHSSGWVNRSSGHAAFYWQEGYGAFSISQSHMGKVRAYIDGQEEHHKARDFKAEFRAFLKRYSIQFDENYIWL
jgi:putative transposase